MDFNNYFDVKVPFMQFSLLHVCPREKVNFQRYQVEVEKMKWRSKELDLEKRDLTLNLVASKARTSTFSKMTGVGINFIYTS